MTIWSEGYSGMVGHPDRGASLALKQSTWRWRRMQYLRLSFARTSSLS